MSRVLLKVGGVTSRPCQEAARQKAYYDLSVINPGAVAWYCALKLEMLVHLTKALLTEQLRSADVPGLEAAKARLKDELERKLGVEVEVDEIPDLRLRSRGRLLRVF